MTGRARAPRGRNLVNDRVQRYYDRTPIVLPEDPEEAARRGCVRRGLAFGQQRDYMYVFRMIRNEIQKGRDPEHWLHWYMTDPDGDLAVAAYHEAVASTRPARWAQ